MSVKDDVFECEFGTTEDRDAFLGEHFPARRMQSVPGWYALPSATARGSKTSGHANNNGEGNIAVFGYTVTFHGPAAQKARALLDGGRS